MKFSRKIFSRKKGKKISVLRSRFEFSERRRKFYFSIQRQFFVNESGKVYDVERSRVFCSKHTKLWGFMGHDNIFLIFYAHGGEINVRLFIAVCDISSFWFKLLKQKSRCKVLAALVVDPRSIKSNQDVIFFENWNFIEDKSEE